RDPQAVVGEYATPALRLRRAVSFHVPPARHGVLVAPDRERQYFPGRREALETLDGDEAVDLRELGAQARRQVEIVLLAPGRGNDLENDGDHTTSRLISCPAEAAPPCGAR